MQMFCLNHVGYDVFGIVAGGGGIGDWTGGATPVADCGGYGNCSAAIMMGGGMPHNFQ
jgi:hypothetical protein